MVDLERELRQSLLFKEQLPHVLFLLLVETAFTFFHVITAAFALDLAVDLRDVPAGDRDHLNKQHGGIYAVLAVDMAAHGQSAR